MGLFTEEVQRTSVSLYIERLSNLEEVDWYLFQQLSESIQMQSFGSREAIETMRKKLKHGSTTQKQRVLEVLNLLVENSNQQFYKQLLANEKMKDRLEIMLASPSEDPKVKKDLTSLLQAWSVKYKVNPGRKDTIPSSSVPVNTAPTIQEKRRQSLPSQTRTPTKPRSQSNPDHYVNFNFERSKPKIMEEIALANQNSNNLKNALRLINTQHEQWQEDVQEHKERCEASQKTIVRYTRLVENEEWIGTLLAANEELLKGLDMYNIMLAGEIPVNQWDAPLQIQFSDPNKGKEELDPFADPSTPVEERSLS